MTVDRPKIHFLSKLSDKYRESLSSPIKQGACTSCGRQHNIAWRAYYVAQLCPECVATAMASPKLVASIIIDSVGKTFGLTEMEIANAGNNMSNIRYIMCFAMIRIAPYSSKIVSVNCYTHDSVIRQYRERFIFNYDRNIDNFKVHVDAAVSAVTMMIRAIHSQVLRPLDELVIEELRALTSGMDIDEQTLSDCAMKIKHIFDSDNIIKLKHEQDQVAMEGQSVIGRPNGVDADHTEK